MMNIMLVELHIQCINKSSYEKHDLVVIVLTQFYSQTFEVTFNLETVSEFILFPPVFIRILHR